MKTADDHEKSCTPFAYFLEIVEITENQRLYKTGPHFRVGSLRGSGGLGTKLRDEAPCERSEHKILSIKPFGLALDAIQNIFCSRSLHERP